LVYSKQFQANEVLLAFHRVVSVQLTMPQTRYDEPVSDDDVSSYASPPSLRHNSLEGEGTAVAVH